jgi:glyoxylase-like metal-dependent hydrolase (beta-lactamase superfamily II)
MRKLYALIFVALLIVSAGFALQEPDYSKVEIKATKVAGNVYMLESGIAGNIGVSVGEDGVLMIDDQFAPLSDKIKAAVKELGGGTPKFILNTHWHSDHTGGNEIFGREGTLIAHTNVRHRLSNEQNLTTWNRTVPAAPEGAWPVITFDESLALHFNDEEVKVMHYPHGHTDGDAVIFFKGSNVVHMGDNFFSGRFPYVDLDSGGDVRGLIKNTEAVLNEVPDDVKVIPGHGPLSTKDDLKKYHSMLVASTETVSKQMAEGKSVEDVKKAGLPEEWQSWSWSFISQDRWLETIYHSLNKEMTAK